LLKVAATGGEPETLTALDATQHETEHRFPQLLPDGKNLLFVIRHAEEPSFDDADLAVLSLKTGKWKVLLKSGTDPHYLPTGDLVFLRAGVLLTVPFDLAKLKTKGEAVPVLEDVRENPRNGAGQFSISDDGTLVYVPGGISFGDHELVMVDKTGAARSLTATSRPYEDFTVSPDGRSIATTIEGPVTDTWIHDIARDTDTRFTFGVEHRDPTWTPDGKRLAYSGYADGHYGVFWKPVDGGQEERLFASDNPVFAWFWAPSGRILVYAESPPATGDGIGIFSLDTHKATLLPHSSFDEEWASFSPDGKWLAFDSNESGRQEVYVAPFPSLASPTRISTAGGLHPLWAPDGKELYYRTGASLAAMQARTLATASKIMAVSLDTKGSVKPGQPHMLFQGPYFDSGHDWAITPDGRNFILIREKQSQEATTHMNVVLNWFEELKNHVAAR
jgi:Tol biopolymer transport system component